LKTFELACSVGSNSGSCAYAGNGVEIHGSVLDKAAPMNWLGLLISLVWILAVHIRKHILLLECVNIHHGFDLTALKKKQRV
jgi:hypothetical protein